MNSLIDSAISSPRARSYEEKRDFIRMRVVTPAYIEDVHGERQLGLCLNLSGGGALLEFAKGYSVNEHIKVTITSQHGHAPMLESMSKVVRAELKAPTGTTLIAVSYLR